MRSPADSGADPASNATTHLPTCCLSMSVCRSKPLVTDLTAKQVMMSSDALAILNDKPNRQNPGHPYSAQARPAQASFVPSAVNPKVHVRIGVAAVGDTCTKRESWLGCWLSPL